MMLCPTPDYTPEKQSLTKSTQIKVIAAQRGKYTYQYSYSQHQIIPKPCDSWLRLLYNQLTYRFPAYSDGLSLRPETMKEPAVNKKYLMIIIILLVIAACCCLLIAGIWLFSSSDNTSSNSSANTDIALTVTAIVQQNEQTAQLTARTPVPYSPDQTWLIMLYLAGDNNLEEELFFDLNEAELIGSSNQVHIVAQFDRYAGEENDFTGDGNWTTAKRFYLNQDSDLYRIGSTELADLGEVDTAAAETLADFLSWAMTNYPADRNVLIMSDHGSGWLGGWQDDESGSNMYPEDLEAGLKQGLRAAGVGRLDMIGFDACLMSQIEIISSVAPYARYMVASEEYEHGFGWAYAAFLNYLTTNPGITSADLATRIVESFIAEDIVFADLPGAEQEIEKYLETQTLSAIDLDAYPTLLAAINNLAYKLQYTDQSSIASARSYAQSFDNIFQDESRRDQVPPSYIDLNHFIQIIQSLAPDNQDITSAVAGVESAIRTAVIAEKHGRSVPGASGISIFFPNSTLYSWVGFEDSAYSYPQIARSFSNDSLWDDFLAFHYTQQAFKPSENLTALASKSAPLVMPGAGEITFSPVEQSATDIAANQTVSLTTTITGSNIAFIYTDIAYYWEDDNSFLTADMNFIWADATKEVDGIYYPDWGTGVFPVSFDWEPAMYYISDGTNYEALALVYPKDYGPPDEPAVYGVDGVYKVANGGAEYEATISFTGDGTMREIVGLNPSAGGVYAPFQIRPQIGDQFFVYQEWFEGDEFVYYLHDTPLIYSGQDFTFNAYDAEPGLYIVGFIVEDFEGNLYFSDYVEITVRERE